MHLLELTSKALALATTQDVRTSLHLVVWTDDAVDPCRGFGPFTTLQEALNAVAAVEELCAPDQYVLLTGRDECGAVFDAYEPEVGEDAEVYRAGQVVDAAEAARMWSEEAQRSAGMAHGNRGLADYARLEVVR